MTRREAILTALSAVSLKGQNANDRRGAARDLVYRALEQLSAHATPEDVTKAIRLLRAALDQYPSFGDAHYYRFKCLEYLKQDLLLQKSDLDAAQRYDAEALRDQRDPFKLAVPRIYDHFATVGQKWALVVGINRFQHPEVPKLGNAADDATDFANVLKDPEVGRFPEKQVQSLINEQATAAAIKGGLNSIARQAKPEDVVVVYLATHGSARERDIKRVSYLYSWDTTDERTDRDLFFGSALAMVDVSGVIVNRCAAQRTVVILDTCHSGAGFAGQALSFEDMNRLREGAGRFILSSCGENEFALDGLFTPTLIQQLRARKGCVRMTDLFTQVRKGVSDEATKQNQKQTPVMAKSESAAEIVLGAAVGGASDGCLVA